MLYTATYAYALLWIALCQVAFESSPTARNIPLMLQLPHQVPPPWAYVRDVPLTITALIVRQVQYRHEAVKIKG